MLAIAGIGVHVRAIKEESLVLTCYPSTSLRISQPVAQHQIFGRRSCKCEPDEETYNQAWDRTATLKAHLCTLMTKSDFNMRNSVIHLGKVNLLHGRFPFDPGRPDSGIQ